MQLCALHTLIYVPLPDVCPGGWMCRALDPCTKIFVHVCTLQVFYCVVKFVKSISRLYKLEIRRDM
jgi:hypothetical protein